MQLDRPGPTTRPSPGTAAGSIDTVRVLATPRRVAIMAALSAAESLIGADALARRVAALEGGKSPADVTTSERRTVHLSLNLHHLPALSSHGLVEWRSTENAVALGAGVSAERVLALIEHRSLSAAARLFETLSQPRRRLVLSVVWEREKPLSVDDLARLVAAEELASTPAAVSETAVDRIRVSLHHSHLPALSAMDVLEYDTGAGVVTR